MKKYTVINLFRSSLLFLGVTILMSGCHKHKKELLPEVLQGVWSQRSYQYPNGAAYFQYDQLSYTYTFEKNLVFIDDYNYQNRDRYRVSSLDTRDTQDSTIYFISMYKLIGLKKHYTKRTFCFKKSLNRLDFYTLNDDGSLTKETTYYEKVD